jgi:hypothetical protein
MGKVIELQFKDGEVWQIPFEFVAKHRADYYGNKESHGPKERQEEIDFVMNDDYEGHDWLKNNMEYGDFKEVVNIIPNTNPQTKDWINAEAIIKEV